MRAASVSLLDRHIFRSAFFTSLAAMAVFSFILVAGNVVRDVLAQGLLGEIPWSELGRFILLLIPYVAAYALPMGVLTGVLLTLGRLSADNEITAMRAHGIGLPRIALPVLALGVLGAAVAVPTNFWWMPWAAVQKERELADALRSKP
ncbi:MAG: LptF/LptG family permease, partial [Opitutaceae bacterium]